MKNAAKRKDGSLWLLLYWPLYTLAFIMIENVDLGSYTVIHSELDELIPFCVFFILPYLLWFPFWIGMLTFCMIKDRGTFRRTTWYFILTFTFAVIVYIVFPTQQNLRPETFERDNLFCTVTKMIYDSDINRNVLPSEHVIGALAPVFASFDSKLFSKRSRALIIAAAALIISSVLFVKQHSVIDVFAALPVAAAGYFICFRGRENSPICRLTGKRGRGEKK